MSEARVTRVVWICVTIAFALAALPAAAAITRGPYLQMPGPDQMVVIWHTDGALTDPEVEFGTTTSLGTTTLGSSTADLMAGFKHTVSLTGLTPSTKYFYALGSAGGPLTTPSLAYTFTTSPPHGTVQPIRIWTFGDSGYWPGNTGTEYEDTRQAYYDYAGAGDPNAAADATDVMLYLGDNAYGVGDDPTHQTVFFGPAKLAAWLQRQPFFSAIGNHEGFQIGFDSIAQVGDYFDMFQFPTANELGINGVASGSESYYSFDHGNIHFVILDSEENIENIGTTGAPMLTWLEADLMGTTADWIIAAWHRPPYSRGIFHNSDVEANEIDMREVIVPVVEAHGVDLVLSGHSHTYERTPLLDGHYGLSGTLEIAHLKDGGDGDPAGDGSYRKTSTGQVANDGTVYMVGGSAADVRSFNPTEGHPVMVTKLVELGTMVIEVDGDSLVGNFLDDTGAITDTFTIEKGQPRCPSVPLLGCGSASLSKLIIKDKEDDLADRIIWKWLKGTIDAAEITPMDGAELHLCVYDALGPLFSMNAPSQLVLDYATVDVPSWSWRNPKDGFYLFKDKLRSADGLEKVKIKSKGGRTLILVKAKGANSPVPTLPLTLPVTAQLVVSDTNACWTSEFPVAKKNEAGKFVAKSP